MSIPTVENGVRIPKGFRVVHCDGCFGVPLRRDGSPIFDAELLRSNGWSVPDDGTHWCPKCANNDPIEGATS